MPAESGLITVPVRVKPAGRSASLQPDVRQRAAISEVLRSVSRSGQIEDLAVIYTKTRRHDAAWLCAYGRAAGLRARLVATSGSRDDVERAVRRSGAAAVIVLADFELDLPDAVMHLPGTGELSALDVWEPPEQVASQARTILARLGAGCTLHSPCGSRTAVTVAAWRLGHPFGRLEADVVTAEGVFTADRAIAVNRAMRIDCRLTSKPITVRIEAGRATNVSCDDEVLRRLVSRAVDVHGIARVSAVRLGIRDLPGGYDEVPTLANSCRGTGIRLKADPARAYNKASADLTIDLIGSRGGY